MDINLTFIYGIDTNTKQYVYTDATSIVTGFTGSYRWIPENISINFIDSKHFAYHVSGMMEWKFFKSTFNREEKNFKGIIEIK